MKFVYPEILWALSALAVPILVHLFNFRRFKKVAFSNVSFLKEVKQETQSKSRLKHILILVARMIALSAIILAFAQPYFPVENKDIIQGQKAVSIYVDNSFSMEGENGDGRLLDLAKNKALEIVDYYRPDDRFQVLTNDFEGRHQRLVDKEEMIELIEEIEVSPQSVPVSRVYTRQADLLRESGFDNLAAYMLTDLQESTHDLSNLPADSTIALRWVPTTTQSPDNLYLDSVWFETPVRSVNQPEQLNVRIVNEGENDLQNIPLKVSINGVQKALGSFSVESRSTVDTSLFFTHSTPGLKQGVVSISDHPIIFDDLFYLGYEVASQISVLEIQGEQTVKQAFRKVYDGDDYFDYRSIQAGSLNYSDISLYNLVIVNGLDEISTGLSSELNKHMQNGGVVWCVPSADADIESYNSFFTAAGTSVWNDQREVATKVADINLSHSLFEGVFESIPQNIDLPKVQTFYPAVPSSRSGANILLGLQNGSPFLNEYSVGDGKLYTLQVALDESFSNLVQHAIFVTASLRIAEFSQPSTSLYYTIGKDEAINLRNLPFAEETAFHLVDSSQSVDFLPAHQRMAGITRIFTHGQVKNAGNYWLTLNNEVVKGLSFNYSREESVTRRFTSDEIREQIQEMGLPNAAVIDSGLEGIKQFVGELDEGKKLWYGLIILALICLAIEILLIKYWR